MEDPFASIMKFCNPTASQEAKFPNCPLARVSGNFPDSYSDQFSSLPDPTPTDPTVIVMVSLPGSPQNPEAEPVFHIPPQHHASSCLSSSEDPNVNDAVDGHDRRNKVRVSEEVSNGEPEAKKIRATEENLDGETVPVGDTGVIIIGSMDSGDEIAAVNLGEDSSDISSGGRRINVVPKIDESGGILAVIGNYELGKKCKSSENEASALIVSLGEKCKSPENETSDLSGSLNSGKIEGEILKLKCMIGNRCIEVEQKSGVGGSEKVVKITEDAKMCKYRHSNGGLETDGKKIQETGLKTDNQRIEVIDQETDGKRIEEVRLKTDDTRIEVIDKDVIEGIGQTDGKNTDGIGLETDAEKIEGFGQTDGKKFEEFGQADGKNNDGISLETDGIQETGLETAGKRIQEIGLDSNGKKLEDIGLITDDNRSENIGHERNGKRMNDIDEFGDDRSWKGRRRELPVPLEGKEKEVVESTETMDGLLELFLMIFLRLSGGPRVDVDFLEMAKRRGTTLPRPSWWPSDMGTEEIGLETAGKKIQEIGLDSNGKKLEDVGMITDDNRSENIGHERNGKRMKDIDEFGDDRRWKGRRRELPVSLKGKEKESLKGKEKEVVEGAETKHGLLDMLGKLKTIYGDSDGGCEKVDLLETAKRRGLTFPRPRWWSSDEGP